MSELSKSIQRRWTGGPFPVSDIPKLIRDMEHLFDEVDRIESSLAQAREKIKAYEAMNSPAQLEVELKVAREEIIHLRNEGLEGAQIIQKLQAQRDRFRALLKECWMEFDKHEHVFDIGDAGMKKKIDEALSEGGKQ